MLRPEYSTISYCTSKFHHMKIDHERGHDVISENNITEFLISQFIKINLLCIRYHNTLMRTKKYF